MTGCTPAIEQQAYDCLVNSSPEGNHMWFKTLKVSLTIMGVGFSLYAFGALVLV